MPISLIQSNFHNNGGPALTTAVAFSANVTAGSGLMASASIGAGAATLSFSDNINGAWTVAVSQNTRNTTAIGYFASSAGGAITVTATSTVSSNIQLSIGEIGGMLGVSPIDKTGSNFLNTNTTLPTVATSAATSVPGEGVWALIHMSTSETWSNLGTGTLISPSSASSSGTFFFVSGVQAVQSWGPTVSGSNTFGAVIATVLPLIPPIYTRRYVQFNI